MSDLTVINVSPRSEIQLEGEFTVQVSYCQNCGMEVTRRRFSPTTTVEQAHEYAAQDSALFLLHLDTHMPKSGQDN